MTHDAKADHSEGPLSARRQELDVQRQRPPKPRLRTAPASAPDEGISPAFLWQVFCQWWRIGVPAGLLLAVCACYLVWFFHVPMYESIALIEIKSDRPYIAFEKGIENGDEDRFVQTQIELLRSPVVLVPILGRPEIGEMHELKNEVNPLEYLQKHLSIKQIGKSALYEVHYVSPSAQNAAAVANQIVKVYLDMQKGDNLRQTKLVIDVLEKERLDRSNRVEQLRRRVVDLAKEVTGRDPFGQGAVTDVDRALSSASSLHQDLNEVEVQSEILRAELQALQGAQSEHRDRPENSALIDLEISKRADVQELEATRAEIEEKIAARKKVMSSNDFGLPSVGDSQLQTLNQQLASIKAKLAARKTVLGRELQELRAYELKAERQRLIAAKMQELNSLDARRSLLAKKFDKQVAELKAGGAQSAQLEFAKDELAREEKVFELIAARKLSLQTELEAPDRVSKRLEASVPSLALDPIPYKMLLIACLASLVCPFALALAREMAVQRICNPQQLASESQLTVLGQVTRFPIRPVANGHNVLPIRQQREMFIFAESIDSLRTNLMLIEDLGGEGPTRVIAIASAVSGEGKTSVATSLAVSIAAATKKPTLLIDADLRSPDVAEVLGVTTRIGLAEVLTGKASLSEAIHASGQTNTYVLPAGADRVNPHHVIDGPKIGKLFDSLQAKFSTILVDTPPILAASESLIYTKAADRVVFCSLSGVSRAKQVRLAVQRLEATGANVAGAVLSGIPIGRSTYAYGYRSEAENLTDVNS